MGEARSGVVHLTGFPDGPPVHTGFSHGDAVTGLMGAYAVLAALHRRSDDPGLRRRVDRPGPLRAPVPARRVAGHRARPARRVPERSGNQLAVAPAAVINTYRSRDGDWITVTSATAPLGAATSPGCWACPRRSSPRRRQQQAGREPAGRRTARLGGAARRRPSAWRSSPAEVVASRVFDAADIAADPVYAERGDIVTVDDPDLGPVRMQAVLPHFRQRPGQVWRTGPALGQDNPLVYRQWLGLGADELADLEKRGVI